MKTILFPTDFSKNADNALKYALELAKRTSSGLILFNAYQMPHNRADIMVSIMDILKQDSEKGLKETLDKIKANPGYASVDCKTESHMGDVVSVADALVKEKNIELVVMGTRGASGLLETIIGSNTASMIQHVGCPVLAIPENCKYKIPAKICFAYDLKEIKNPADMQFLIQLASLFNAEIQVLNVRPDPQDQDMEQASAEVTLFHYLEGVKHDFFLSAAEDVIQGIQDFIKDHNIDMLVMVAHKYSFFEKIFHRSITRKLAFYTEIPLLALHD